MVLPATTQTGLNVRHDERRSVELPAEFVISDGHASQIHFTSGSGASGVHTIACIVKDVSSGGIGIQARHFLPRLAEGVIRIFQRRGSAGGDPELIFEQRAKVRRVELIGREPRYMLGLAFTDRGPDLKRRVSEVLDRVEPENEEIRDA